MLKYQETTEDQRNSVHHINTVRELLSRATELQKENGKALSTEQLELLAAETGIAPRYLRRALAEQKQCGPYQERSLSNGDRYVLGGVPLLYGILLFAIAWILPTVPGFLGPLLIFFLPPMIAFLSGVYLNSKRLGASSGALIISCMIGGIIVAMHLQNNPPQLDRESLQQIFGMLASGVCSGFAGAGLRQFFRNIHSR